MNSTEISIKDLFKAFCESKHIVKEGLICEINRGFDKVCVVAIHWKEGKYYHTNTFQCTYPLSFDQLILQFNRWNDNSNGSIVPKLFSYLKTRYAFD